MASTSLLRLVAIMAANPGLRIRCGVEMGVVKTKGRYVGQGEIKLAGSRVESLQQRTIAAAIAGGYIVPDGVVNFTGQVDAHYKFFRD